MKIETNTTYSWPAAKNVSADEAIAFANELLSKASLACKEKPRVEEPGKTRVPSLSFTVAFKEFEVYDTWDGAIEYIKIINEHSGPGWRLPTIDELRLMYDHLRHRPGDNELMMVSNGYYWADVSDTGACMKNLITGVERQPIRAAFAYVRAIKDDAHDVRLLGR